MSAHDVRLFGDAIAASRGSRPLRQGQGAARCCGWRSRTCSPAASRWSRASAPTRSCCCTWSRRSTRRRRSCSSTPASISPRRFAIATSSCARFGLTNLVLAEPDAKVTAAEDPEKFLFASDPDRCCDIRKVQPLARALDGYDAWITGRKGFQTATRSRVPLFEAEGDRVKVNPLVGWSATDLLDYIRAAGLPPHPLVAKGFPSIGCLPCTSRVAPGEDPRAGRWRGRAKTECGIHAEPLSAGQDI